MTPRARIIGLGQALAMDDGVGLCVIDSLRARAPAGDLELFTATDASALVALLETPLPVVIVDAAIGEGTAGDLLLASPEDLGTTTLSTLSSHGMGVVDAIKLARVLAPEAVAPSIRILAICITPPRRYAVGLSQSARESVARAVRALLDVDASDFSAQVR